ncbi:MAG: LexA family transcriptional regulator [Desulfurococcales archaeon]|nr:LexA family transcriptional regulator [Desulfurococcales archaeon]
MDRSTEDPLILLGGTSLRVYLYLLHAGKPVGIRELQRDMGFKSPTTARHHLEKLVELGLARRVEEGFIAVKPRGVLGGLYNILGVVVPRSVLLSSFLATSTLICLLTRECGILGLSLFIVGTSISVWESYMFYRDYRELVKGG